MTCPVCHGTGVYVSEIDDDLDETGAEAGGPEAGERLRALLDDLATLAAADES